MIKNKKGFTLAEILVTITIIGILAANTIPQLVMSVSMTQYQAAYKKNYAMIAQATKEICDDNGGTMVNAFEAIPDDGWSDFDKVPTMYSRYLKTMKTCKKWQTNGFCFPAYFAYLNGNPATGTGITQTDMLNISGGYAGMLLVDGTGIGISYGSPSCTSTSWVTGNICAKAIMDVNGLKKPNIWGKDIYGFYIFKNGTIRPFGLSTDEVAGSHHTTCIANNTGADNLGLKCSFDYLVQ